MYYRYQKNCKKCGEKLLTNKARRVFHEFCSKNGLKKFKINQRKKYLKNKTPPEYNYKRRQVHARDNFECQSCGLDLKSNDKIKHTHHINRNRQNNVYSNLITLCAKCHKGVHSDKIENKFKIKNFSPGRKTRKRKKTRKKFLFKNI